jgi:hypothetical protein
VLGERGGGGHACSMQALLERLPALSGIDCLWPYDTYATGMASCYI